jgi:flavin reductase (DIM6/NTAB) family NADH-FMN oxidoreductase RutF
VEAGDDLRELMRRLPAPVCVVTIELEGRPYGLTVGSVVSLSLDPPLVGLSISHQAQLHELLREVDRFAVSALAADQDGVAQHFARGTPPIAMWSGIAVRQGDGPPLLEGAVGWLRCRREHAHETGDHTFFVGRVESVEQGAPGPALAYVGQRYVSL